MGRGGFPPSETGSFSAHHTAQWVGFFNSGVRCQVSGLRKSVVDLRFEVQCPTEKIPEKSGKKR
jgi:hypothetical protein